MLGTARFSEEKGFMLISYDCYETVTRKLTKDPMQACGMKKTFNICMFVKTNASAWEYSIAFVISVPTRDLCRHHDPANLEK